MLFNKALEKINSILKEAVRQRIVASYALIGGMAVTVWGVVRATKDVDFVVSLNHQESALSEFEKLLKKRAITFIVHKGDFSDPIGLLIDLQVPIRSEKVSVQLIIATKPWENEFAKATTEVKMGKGSIPVINVEELILMKLKAGGPLDIYDAKGLMKINKDKRTFNKKELVKKSKDMRVDKKLKKIMEE